MSLRHLARASIFLFSACATAPSKAPPPALAPLEVVTFRAAVTEAPADAQHLVLSVRWPEDGGRLQLVSATGLVGNALCEFPVQGAGTASGTREARFAHATLCSRPLEADAKLHEFVVETSGKPVELELRIARAAGASVSADELEEALAGATTASADGQPLHTTTRLVRVR